VKAAAPELIQARERLNTSLGISLLSTCRWAAVDTGFVKEGRSPVLNAPPPMIGTKFVITEWNLMF